MKEQFTIYTAKNGERYIQTKNKYLAHGLAFCGFRFMVFKENETNIEVYSFNYSEELVEVLTTIIEFRRKNAKSV